MKRLLALGLLLIAPVLAPAAEPAADEADEPLATDEPVRSV